MDNANPSSKDTIRRPPAAYLTPRQYHQKERVPFSEEEEKRFVCTQIYTRLSYAASCKS